MLSTMVEEKDDKREQILAAALTAFARYGYKQTTMDSIAEETDLSRSGLYLYYKNKKDIFRSVAQSLHTRALEQAATAMALDASLEDKLYAAFLRRDAVFSVVYESPHGDELIDLSIRVTADIAAEAEQGLVMLLAGFFEDALRNHDESLPRTAISPHDYAELLVHSSMGLKDRSTSFDQFHEKLKPLIQIFVAAISPK